MIVFKRLLWIANFWFHRVLPARALHRKALCYSQDESLYYESLYNVLLLTGLLYKNKKPDHLLLQSFLSFISFSLCSLFFFLIKITVEKGAIKAFRINFMFVQIGYYFCLCSPFQPEVISPNPP